MKVIDCRPSTGCSVEDRTFVSQADAHERVAASIVRVAGGILKPRHDKLVVVAIGTDRSTGDALGPLVGSRLGELLRTGDVEVLGCLQAPVHANNLREVLTGVSSSWDHPFIIATDACLGSVENVGSVAVGPGPLLPGAGVNKKLPQIGDMHITGTVNVGGFMEYFVLQNTRLSLVMSMAELIADALAEAVEALIKRRPAAGETAGLLSLQRTAREAACFTP